MDLEYDKEEQLDMALIECTFYSEVLGLMTTLTVILPEHYSSQNNSQKSSTDGLYKTLYLLHGLSDDHSAWSRYSLIERYAIAKDLAVVMPQVDRSFYTDMAYGNKYWTFLTEEVPRIARSFFRLSSAREDNFVAGFSMGGYGAFKWALRHPDHFAAAASIAGVLDIADPLLRDRYGHHFTTIFGEQDIKGTDNDLIHLLEQVNRIDTQRPLLYQCCGTEDFLYQNNQAFRVACEQTSLPHTYVEQAGAGHDWTYSDAKIKDILDWLPLNGDQG